MNAAAEIPLRIKVLHGVAWVTLTTALALLLLAGTWLLWPHEGFTKVDIQFVDQSGHRVREMPVVRPGQELSYQIAYCVGSETPIPVTVRRAIQLQNHVVTYALSEIGYQVTKPCEEVIRVLTIPPFIRPGRYRLLVYTDLQVTPLQRVYQVWTSPDFEIAP